MDIVLLIYVFLFYQDFVPYFKAKYEEIIYLYIVIIYNLI